MSNGLTVRLNARKMRHFIHTNLIKGESKMTPSTINIITNIIGVLLVILEPVKSYLSTQPFEWGTFGICVLSAVIAYFTSKSTLAGK